MWETDGIGSVGNARVWKLKINRRKYIGAVIAALAGVPLLGKFLVKDNFNLDLSFRALIDTFVPRDDYPGAIDAGIHETLLKTILKNESYTDKVIRALRELDEISQTKFNESFHGLDLERRTQILSHTITDNSFKGNTRIQLFHLRLKTLTNFYISEQAFDMLDYHPPSQGGYSDYHKSYRSDVI